MVLSSLPLKLRPEHHQVMYEHVLSCLPDEACGMLGGLGGEVRLVIPVPNVCHSPFRFRMDPAGQIEAMRRIEEAGLDMVAIYHSHPEGPAAPSPTDLEEAAYPEALYLIWSLGEDGWSLRAFRFVGTEPSPVPILVDKGTPSPPVRLDGTEG